MSMTNITDLFPENKLERFVAKRRETDADRRARFGWDPFVGCVWCGDSGYNPDLTTHDEKGNPIPHECHCEEGVKRQTQHVRTEIWPNLVPARFRDYTLAGHPNHKLANDVGGWLDAHPTLTGENLVIQGNVGAGKTGAAIGALRELHFQEATVRYWSLPDLLDQLRAEEFERGNANAVVDSMRKRPTMSWLTDCDCLLLDDMGTERPTQYVTDRIYVIVNNRYTNNRPTIITTNHTEGFDKYLGERVASRINENVRYVRANGSDMRRRAT